MVVQKDIADALGISIATVSRALNDDPRISSAVRQQVASTARKLGYRQKHKKQLASGQIAGILVPEVLSEYYARLVHTANNVFASKNFTTVLRMTSFDQATMARSINEFKTMGVDCILLVIDESETLSEAVLAAVADFASPVFFITMKYIPHFDYDCLFVDEFRGIEMALEHLTRLGWTRIGFIGEQQTIGRYEAFLQITSRLGLDVLSSQIKIVNQRFAAGGYLAMQELLQEKDLPQAIFVSYDQMAIGAIQALDQAGLSVPADMALVGFDGSLVSEYVGPGLTTISAPYQDMVAIAVRVLLSRLEDGPAASPQQIALKPELLVRGSTKFA